MGSVSDYEVMAEAVAMLEAFGVDFEKRVVSAHRTPDLLCEYAKTAREPRYRRDHRRGRRRGAPAGHGGLDDSRCPWWAFP